MTRPIPAIVDTLVGSVVKLTTVRRAARWRPDGLLDGMAISQLRRCLADIAVTLLEQHRREKRWALHTARFGCKHHLSEHGENRGERL